MALTSDAHEHSRPGPGRIAPALAVLLVALVALLPAKGTAAFDARASGSRPHVVVIMADDLDVELLDVALALGLMPALRTHVVDRGVRFEESFVVNSLCCPSRATFLTGQYSHNNGVLSNHGPHGGVRRLRDDSTLATWLQAAGYRTGHVGKYLNGYGIDLVIGEDSGVPQYDPTYVPPGWDDWQALVDTTTYQVWGYTLNDNGRLVVPDAYQTDELATRAVDFIEESVAVGGPFFLAVMPLAPHVEIGEGDSVHRWRDAWTWTIRPAPRHAGSVVIPLLPALKPSFDEVDYADKPVWRPRLRDVDLLYLRRQYRDRLASLRAVDDLIGRVVDALGPELEHTLILFTSDNGFLHGEHRLPEKLTPYEESIRVPLYVRVPGQTSPRSIRSVVLNTDLAPFIADLAGAIPELPVDGRSLVPLLGGEPPAPWRNLFLVEHWWNDSVFAIPTYAAVRTGDADRGSPMIYVEYYDQNDRQVDDGVADPVMFRELYDLSADPDQLESLHRDPARIPAMVVLGQVLSRLRECGSSPEQEERCQDLEDL